MKYNNPANNGSINGQRFCLFNRAKEKSSKKVGIGHRTLLNSKFPQSYLRKIRPDKYRDCKTVKGDLLRELSLFESIQIGKQSDQRSLILWYWIISSSGITGFIPLQTNVPCGILALGNCFFYARIFKLNHKYPLK